MAEVPDGQLVSDVQAGGRRLEVGDVDAAVLNYGANLEGIQVLGELYDGALGRTLGIELKSIDAVRWLRAIFLEVAEQGATHDLARLEPVRLRNVSQLEWRVVGKPP
jgi:hypothetical protein